MHNATLAGRREVLKTKNCAAGQLLRASYISRPASAHYNPTGLTSR
jgi:hypothetical protein